MRVRTSFHSRGRFWKSSSLKNSSQHIPFYQVLILLDAKMCSTFISSTSLVECCRTAVSQHTQRAGVHSLLEQLILHGHQFGIFLERKSSTILREILVRLVFFVFATVPLASQIGSWKHTPEHGFRNCLA